MRLPLRLLVGKHSAGRRRIPRYSHKMNFVESIQNLVTRSKSSPVQTALAASAILGTLALAYFQFAPTKSDLAPAITEEEAKEMMNSILKKLKLLVPKLLMAAQNIKMQIQQQGHDVDEMTIMKQYLLPHFDSNLKEIQDAVLEEFDVDEDELEEAVNKYIADGDEELASIAKSIRVMYQQFGGDIEIEDVAAPKSAKVESMGAEDVVSLLKELANQMMQYTDDFCGTFIDENGLPSTQQGMEEFQLGLMAVSQKAEKALLDECGLTEADLQQLLMANQENPQVQKVFMTMQADNAKILAKHGIRMMG